MKKTVLCLVAALLVSGLAFAQDDGPWKLRLRMIAIQPNESSDAIPTTGGTEIGVDSNTVPEVDLSYQINEKWGLELVATLSSHDLATEGGGAPGIDSGEATLLPPTLMVQYFFGERIRPYIGAGINFTTFSYDLPDDGNPSDDIRDIGVTDVDLDSSFGFAIGGGVDFPFAENWLFNVDAKYVTISTDATVKGGPLNGATIGLDIDPWIFGVGIGYRF
jgi:outer membrane protein